MKPDLLSLAQAVAAEHRPARERGWDGRQVCSSCPDDNFGMGGFAAVAWPCVPYTLAAGLVELAGEKEEGVTPQEPMTPKEITLAKLATLMGISGDVFKTMPIEVPDVGRDDFARWTTWLGYTEGVEIGVKEGDYSVVLLESNPNLHLRSVDPWLVRDGYRDHREQAVFDVYERKARLALAKFGSRSTVCKGFSVDVARSLPDRSIDFVYIDGHHSFQAATNDICEWLPKIKPGGIIAGHDYAPYKDTERGLRELQGNKAKEVVDAFTAAYRIRPWFVLGRKEKREGEVRDQHRSFMWVVE